MSEKTVEVYPQLGSMFQKAMTSLMDGETEAEKQIVYVLREAMTAMVSVSAGSIPAYVAPSPGGGYGLFVAERRTTEIVNVAPGNGGTFRVASAVNGGEPKMVDGVLALAAEIIAAMKAAGCTIVSAGAMTALGR
jgi:hypothetical protein